MALTPLPDPPQTADPANFATRADALVVALANMVAEINGGAVPLAAGTLQGDLLFVDNIYDIGKTGATRPRDLFLSRNLGVPGTSTLAAVNVSGNITKTNGTGASKWEQANNSAAYFGTTSNNSLVLIANNTGALELTAAGGIIVPGLSPSGISVGANDSGGVGYKVLRVPN